MGCESGIYYTLIDNTTGVIFGNIGDTISLVGENLNIIGLYENCYTFTNGTATNIIEGDLTITNITDCTDVVCTVTPTPTPSITTTPSVTSDNFTNTNT